MPVWHELTEEWREAEDLVVIGITQEQHPDRCRLFAQWHGIDWPILWDPLNLTGMSVVPVFTAIDEHGIVQATKVRPSTFEETFLRAEFAAPEETPKYVPRIHAKLLDEKAPSLQRAYAQLLWGGDKYLDEAVTFLSKNKDPKPEELFRLGVAQRLRYDSAKTRPGDFQGSIDSWTGALRMNPNQYIWRRRIQQYGPRLDKPYPFYDWVSEAQAALRESGVEPYPIVVPLTGTEIADGTRAGLAAAEGSKQPDADAKIERDEHSLVGIEGAVALHTGGRRAPQRSSARAHLTLRPNAKKDVHWTNDAGACVVWVDTPEGWVVERNLFQLEAPAKATSSEVRRIDFEISFPDDHKIGGKLKGYALYYVCEGESGKCVYKRQDFELTVGAVN